MIAVGGQCWFAASDAMRGALVEHFKKIGPTEMCIQVPRIWEKFHENLVPQLQSAKGLKRMLIDWSMKQVLGQLGYLGPIQLFENDLIAQIRFQFFTF